MNKIAVVIFFNCMLVPDLRLLTVSLCFISSDVWFNCLTYPLKTMQQQSSTCKFGYL